LSLHTQITRPVDNGTWCDSGWAQQRFLPFWRPLLGDLGSIHHWRRWLTLLKQTSRRWRSEISNHASWLTEPQPSTNKQTSWDKILQWKLILVVDLKRNYQTNKDTRHLQR
jgi:hypothetical protein